LRLLDDGDPELIMKPWHRSTDDVMDCGRWPTFHDRSEGSATGVIEPRWLAGCLAIDRPALAVGVEHHHPVPHSFQCHATDPGRFGAACAVLNRCQGQ